MIKKQFTIRKLMFLTTVVAVLSACVSYANGSLAATMVVSNIGGYVFVMAALFGACFYRELPKFRSLIYRIDFGSPQIISKSRLANDSEGLPECSEQEH